LILLLLGLAVKRGLFTLDYAWNTDDAFLKVDPLVNAQAVFVAADKHGNLHATEPMHYNALNPKPQDACVRDGLSQRNTMYSFRRTGLYEALREHGREQARTLAGHSLQSDVLHTHYDTVGMGDVDIQGWRFGTEQSSRKEMSKKPWQGHTTVCNATKVTTTCPVCAWVHCAG
jgi:hypothetical protein